ncbi:unnamed protein product [Parnassius mnemosyne]|uniref:Uncharacterized protein n=1 Tax=Parnassius mnemosyne TaxID=213953 RepID=A0AAV1LDM2_9NEOP
MRFKCESAVRATPLRRRDRAARTPHSALRTPHSALRTPHSALRTPQCAAPSCHPTPAPAQPLQKYSNFKSYICHGTPCTCIMCVLYSCYKEAYNCHLNCM